MKKTTGSDDSIGCLLAASANANEHENVAANRGRD